MQAVEKDEFRQVNTRLSRGADGFCFGASYSFVREFDDGGNVLLDAVQVESVGTLNDLPVDSVAHFISCPCTELLFVFIIKRTKVLVNKNHTDVSIFMEQ